MKIIRAIFEDGVFKPFDPVEMPEGTYVQLHATPVTLQPPTSPDQKLSAIYSILSDQKKRVQIDRAAQRLE